MSNYIVGKLLRTIIRIILKPVTVKICEQICLVYLNWFELFRYIFVQLTLSYSHKNKSKEYKYRE